MENNVPIPSHAHIIIIGSGGSGMSLLWALIKEQICRKQTVLVIEPETKDKNDRTWCFWAHKSDDIVRDYQSIIQHSWPHVQVGGTKKKLNPYRYYHLKSADFYRFVKSQCTSIEHFFNLQDAVVSIDNNTVITAQNRVFTSDYIFDSRLPSQKPSGQMPGSSGMLWQSFLGYTVQIDNPLFKTDTIDMMNFNIDQEGQCQFIYLLPFSETQALIEITRFGTQCLSSKNDSLILEKWIHEHYGNFTVTDTEEGKIPMDLGLNPTQKYHPINTSVIPIGTAAGNVKSTTGYAFYSMYKHSHLIAKALKSKTKMPQAYHKKRFAFYDQLLLHILKNKPTEGKRIFNQLLEKTDLPRVLHFLDEKTKLWNEIPLLLSLPKRLFLRSFFSIYFNKTIGLNSIWKSK